MKGVEPIGRLLDHVCQTFFALAFASLKNAPSPRTLRAWLPQKTLKNTPVTFLSRDPLTVNYLTQKDCIAYYARTMQRSFIAYEHAPHIRATTETFSPRIQPNRDAQGSLARLTDQKVTDHESRISNFHFSFRVT